MAKKRKKARPAASRGAKKKKAARRAPAPRPRALADVPVAATGLEDPANVNLKPLKQLIKKHIERLSTSQSPAALRALDSLRSVQTSLSSDCDPTMVIPLS